MIRIAVDAIGGDHAPLAIVNGALSAARHLDVQIALVGAPAAIAPAVERHTDWRHLPVRIVEAPDVIEMADAAGSARRKPGVSIRVAADPGGCDGFTGKVVMKTSERLADAVEALLGEELRATFSSHVGYPVSRRAFRRFRRRADDSEYGGAPLAGVAGLAIVGHGRSSAKAVRHAIVMAARFAAGSFTHRVEQQIAGATVSQTIR